MLPQVLNSSEKEELIAYLPANIGESDRLDAWILAASKRVSREYFGKAYVYALSLIVAHKATIEMRGTDGGVGSVTSLREGDVSISYSGAGGAASDSDLGATSYGNEYAALLKQYGKRPIVTGTTNGSFF